MSDRIGLSLPGAIASVIPFLCAILGALISNFPVSFMDGIAPAPLLAFMPVYFWCLVRPDLMPAPAVLIIGALEDLLSGGPMGIWAASFIIAYALVDRERDAFAGLSGYGAILGFGAAMFVAGTSAYLIAAFSYDRFPPVMPIFLEIVVTVVLYIPGLWILNFVHHRLIGALRSDF
jgi:rod shape-determining protein MreD